MSCCEFKVFGCIGVESLYLRIQRNGSRAYIPAVYLNPNRLKARFGLVDGNEQYVESGTYALRDHQPGRGRVWLAVGQDPELALIAKQQKEYELLGMAMGFVPAAPDILAGQPFSGRTLAVTSPPSLPSAAACNNPNRLSIFVAMDAFLDDAEQKNAPRTLTAYRNHLRLFRRSLDPMKRKVHMDELTRAT